MQWAYHLMLPWATFAVLFAATYVRMIRAYVIETLGRGLRPHRAREGRARDDACSARMSSATRCCRS